MQDQGFTRPSVLILVPFRSFALRWVTALTSHTPPPSFQIENHTRFQAEYGLPPGAVDKLAEAAPGVYPRDHVEMFKGNVDDSFRLGIKVTRKSVKLFSEFYTCDVIVASPLGLRMSIEKEKYVCPTWCFLPPAYTSQKRGFPLIRRGGCRGPTRRDDDAKLGSCAIRLLELESNAKGFTRYRLLEDQALGFGRKVSSLSSPRCYTGPLFFATGIDNGGSSGSFLRQTILFAAYETPDTRALFNKSLKNVAGKIRSEHFWPPLQVPEGIEPVSAFADLYLTLLTTVARVSSALTVQARRMNLTSVLTISSST